MSNAGTMVYGWDLSGRGRLSYVSASDYIADDNFDEDLIEVRKDMKMFSVNGFISPYCGNYDPFAFGVSLKTFRTYSNVLLEHLMVKVTEDVQKQLEILVNDLDEEQKVFIKHLGLPQLFVLWHD